MTRELRFTTRLLAIVLLVGVAATACSRRDTQRDPAIDAPPAAASISTPDYPGATSLAVESPTVNAGANGAAATPDPLDSMLQGLEQSLNGIDSSVSESDDATGAGE